MVKWPFNSNATTINELIDDFLVYEDFIFDIKTAMTIPQNKCSFIYLKTQHNSTELDIIAYKNEKSYSRVPSTIKNAADLQSSIAFSIFRSVINIDFTQ